MVQGSNWAETETSGPQHQGDNALTFLKCLYINSHKVINDFD